MENVPTCLRAAEGCLAHRGGTLPQRIIYAPKSVFISCPGLLSFFIVGPVCLPSQLLVLSQSMCFGLDDVHTYAIGIGVNLRMHEHGVHH